MAARAVFATAFLVGALLTLGCSGPSGSDGGPGGGAGGSGGGTGGGSGGVTSGTCELGIAPLVGSNACIEYTGYTSTTLSGPREACADGGTWTNSGVCPRTGTVGACRSGSGGPTATAWYFASFTVQAAKDLPCNSAVDSTVVLDPAGNVIDPDTRDTVVAGCARNVTTTDRVTCAVTPGKTCTEYLGLWPKLWRNDESTNVCVNATTDTGGPCPGSIVEAATWSETGCVHANYVGGCKFDRSHGHGEGSLTIVWKGSPMTANEVSAWCTDAGVPFVAP